MTAPTAFENDAFGGNQHTDSTLKTQQQRQKNRQVLVRVTAQHKIENLALWNAELDDDSDDDDSVSESGSDCNEETDDCGGSQPISMHTSTGILDFCGVIVDIQDRNENENENEQVENESSSFQIGDVVIGSTSASGTTDSDTSFHLKNQPLHDFVITDSDNVIKIPTEGRADEDDDVSPNTILRNFSPTICRTVLKGFHRAGLWSRLMCNKFNSNQNENDPSWLDDEISMVIVMNEEEQPYGGQQQQQPHRNSMASSASIVALELAQALGVTRRVALCASELDVQAADRHGATEIVRVTKKRMANNNSNVNGQLSVYPPTTITIPTPTEEYESDLFSDKGSNITDTSLKSWLVSNEGEFDFIFKEEVGRSLWSTTKRQTVTLKHIQCRQLLKSQDDLLLGDTCALIECVWSKHRPAQLPTIECYRLCSGDDIATRFTKSSRCYSSFKERQTNDVDCNFTTINESATIHAAALLPNKPTELEGFLLRLLL